MDGLHTLRGLAGLGLEPCALSESALVMIDCQNTYRMGVMKLRGVEEALDEARRLLDRARGVGAPILHIAHDAGPGTPYDVSSEIGQIADIVAPQGEEPTIIKNYPNSFVETDLHERLQRLGCKNLILAGFMTHMCVNSTARGAFNLGYRATVVGRATATRDVPAGDRVIEANVLHDASLAALGDLFAVIAERASDVKDRPDV